jgi:hypothetical protein
MRGSSIGAVWYYVMRAIGGGSGGAVRLQPYVVAKRRAAVECGCSIGRAKHATSRRRQQGQ